MVRGNCDYIFLQPIYNKSQRVMIWDLEAAFMEKKDFNTLMDQVIERKLLPGNSAQTPKKQVRIMCCADFEDSCIPQEKFYSFIPLPMDMLPPFRLCHPKYWEESVQQRELFESVDVKPASAEIRDARSTLGILNSAI